MNFKTEVLPKRKISQEELKRILDYDPDSGLFRWKVDCRNNIKKGDMAGTLRENTKLIYIMIKGAHYKADKLAFLYMTGKYPKYEIQHKNGVRFLNGWDNLEIETIPEIKNYAKKKNSIRGVFQNENYKVTIYYDRQRCSLGSYKDFDEAVCARYAGEQIFFGDIKSPASEYVKTKIQKRN